MRNHEVMQNAKHDIRWALARGIVIGIFGTCSVIIASLELAVVIKELLK